MASRRIACAACQARSPVTTVRDAFVPGQRVDTTLGLADQGGDVFACRDCGTRYSRTVDRAAEFHDADLWYFTRLDADEPTPRIGCAACQNDDAEAAWTAGRAEHLGSLIDESHYDIAITRCHCGQHFVRVFTERIDWVNGEDDQTSLLMPLSTDEVARVRACPLDGLRELLHTLGHGRRFVMHWYPTGGHLQTAWRDGGFWIGPHD